MAALQTEVQRSEATVHVMLGNHEQVSDATGDHALGPLAPVAQIVEQPTLIDDGPVELILVPFLSARHAAVDALGWALDRFPVTPVAGEPKPRALFVHLGIRDDQTKPWLRNATDAIDVADLVRLAEQHGIGAVFAGNWHDRRRWRTPRVEVFQLGALAPTGWDNPGLTGYGTVGLWDPLAVKPISYVEVAGPRFVTASDPAELEALRAKAAKKGISLFVEYTQSNGAAPPPKVEGVVVDVVPDRAEVASAARSAAVTARSAATLEQALVGYVDEMLLPPSLEQDRAEVARRAATYLGRSA
jgi:hypothetical protein